MRKIYSIVLMACAMLLSTSLFAVDVTTRQQIQDAINDGIGSEDPVDIVLGATINVDAVITIQDGQTVNLNLNGFNMTAGNPTVFTLKKGTLNITGTGTIDKTGKSSTDAIRVYGSLISTDADYSNLTIGENVTVKSHGTANADGEETTNAITIMEQSGKTAAFGVNVNIKGTVYGTKYGVKINGNVSETTGNIPYVKIWSTAEVYAAPNSNNSIAVYSSGYGKFDIEGYVHGATGVCIKGGVVNLNNAVVKSDYTKTYNDPETRKNKKGNTVTSGINAGGSAIVIASQTGYPGNQEVVISGDTKVTGGTGYAVDEALLKGDTRVNAVTIEGGTIEAGGKGAIIITKETAEGENNNITIVGGNIDDNVFIRDHGIPNSTSVDNFLPEIDPEDPDQPKYNTSAVTDPATGKTTIVVTKLDGDIITPNSVVEKDGEGKFVNADKEIKWVVSADAAETLEENLKLKYLEMNDDAHKQTLTVKEGVTLTIGRVVMGANAQIVVKKGAKLIIDGAQGVVAPVASNIVLETAEGNPAIFLFDPAVKSNRHPKATVNFTSKSYKNADGSYIYQFFGSPFMAVENITASSSTYKTQLDVWNADHYDRIGIINGSSPLDYSKFTTKFGFYSMIANNPINEEQTYTMTGSIVGNEAPALPLYAGWTGMSNAYTGNIDIANFAEAILARMNDGSNVEMAIYTYRQMGNILAWDPNNPLQMLETKIEPMHPFMLHNESLVKEELTLNYNDLVWTPATSSAPSSAPARRNIPADMTKATLRVNGANDIFDLLTIAESDEFTTGHDNYDAAKYMNGEIDFYVMDEKKMSILATDDVENTYLGFASAKGGEFTISFENVQGNALTLIDLVNNTSVDMTEGATYTFTAAANEANDYRFKVVNRRNAATAVENVEASVKAEGIYTLTGMYLGNMSVWNTLPAGIYVVNGEKMVK